MYIAVIKTLLGRDYSSFVKNYPDFEKMISNVEITGQNLVNATDSLDVIKDNSVCGDYIFFSDTNLMKCLCASSVVMSDKFSKRLSDNKFVISNPNYIPMKLRLEDKEPLIGNVLSAKEWNNFWKDVNSWSKDSKPLTSIEKKPLLFCDLSGIFDGDNLVSFEQGIIPIEMIYVNKYKFDNGIKLSPIIKDVNEIDVDTWVLNGLK